MTRTLALFRELASRARARTPLAFLGAFRRPGFPLGFPLSHCATSKRCRRLRQARPTARGAVFSARQRKASSARRCVRQRITVEPLGVRRALGGASDRRSRSIADRRHDPSGRRVAPLERGRSSATPGPRSRAKDGLPSRAARRMGRLRRVALSLLCVRRPSAGISAPRAGAPGAGGTIFAMDESDVRSEACCERQVPVVGVLPARWTCPTCSREWVHIEDEAEGGYYVPRREDRP